MELFKLLFDLFLQPGTFYLLASGGGGKVNEGEKDIKTNKDVDSTSEQTCDISSYQKEEGAGIGMLEINRGQSVKDLPFNKHKLSAFRLCSQCTIAGVAIHT